VLGLRQDRRLRDPSALPERGAVEPRQLAAVELTFRAPGDKGRERAHPLGVAHLRDERDSLPAWRGLIGKASRRRRLRQSNDVWGCPPARPRIFLQSYHLQARDRPQERANLREAEPLVVEPAAVLFPIKSAELRDVDAPSF